MPAIPLDELKKGRSYEGWTCKNAACGKRVELIDVVPDSAPTDEESLIRHCTLGRAEMDLIQAKRTPHNRLGLAIQLCFLRHLGRAILPGETPPAPMVAFLA